MSAALGVRVSGRLTAPAQLLHTAGQEPHALLQLTIQPPQGLPYAALMDLGTDVADQMLAEQLLPQLRRQALVSVGAHGTLAPRTDHGHAVIPLIAAHGLLVLACAPANPAPAAPTPSPETTPHAD